MERSRTAKPGASPPPGDRTSQPRGTANRPHRHFFRAQRPNTVTETAAAEDAGEVEAVEARVAAGYKGQNGHTLGSYEDGVEALARGAGDFTHLFNAMTALHHREPGMVGAALAHATYSEIIPDLLHAHPGAIRVALRSIPCLYCVTDSTAAAGMPDGQYKLGRHKVTKCLGGVRRADGTLAGP